MLVQLKKIQVEFPSKIESQMEVVAKVRSLECHKLQSLLEDNIMKHCQELLDDDGVSAEDDARRRGQGGATT
jgi:hypothetical protein